jgi:hypothetical protein
MTAILRALCCVILSASFLGAQSEKIPIMDGGAGPCSLELNVTGADVKPAYAATVKVHIEYGFGGFHKLDLEAGTNSDGKVKFTGIPARVHRPPLEFHASKDAFEGVATYDPSAECQAKHEITLQKPKE